MLYKWTSLEKAVQWYNPGISGKPRTEKLRWPLNATIVFDNGEMVGWHHKLNGYEFELTLGDREGQGNLVLCSPCDFNGSDMTE